MAPHNRLTGNCWFYADDQIAILGLNTARALTVKGGRISVRQMARIRARLCFGMTDVVKMIVTHHPFDVPPGYEDRDVVGRARLAIETLAACGADLLLAGHLHTSYLGQTAARYKIGGYFALIIQAGTATSTRYRSEANAFNLIRIVRPYVTVVRLTWQPGRGTFITTASNRFRHTPAGWVPCPGVPALDLIEPDHRPTC